MRAIVPTGFGGPEVLQVGEARDPELRPGDILIGVRAAGVNRADLLQRMGRYPPPNGESEIHDDGWQTDVSTWGGPLGRSPHTISSQITHDCGSITFDREGRVISVCVGVGGPELYMFDPNTLETLATFPLPLRQSIPDNIYQDYTGGGYFYLDNHDRVVTATTTHHIYVIGENGAGFALRHDYDLTHVLTSTENLTSALPDSHGLL